MDTVTRDCRSCEHAQFINRFKVHCDAIDRDLSRPRKCADYALSKQAQVFVKATKGVKS